MSTDVYRRDQSCYLGERNRKAAAGRLLRAGYIIYARTPIIIHFKNNTPFNFFDWYSTNEYIIDLTRIQVCFEHYLKAQLMLHGFVVHRFKKSEKKLSDRLKDSKTGLILIKDMMKQVSFIYDAVAQRNYIPQLLEQTLGFGDMIDQAAIHKIPVKVIEILKNNNKIRNVLHYFEAEPEGYDPSALREVIAFTEAVMPQQISDLADELQIPNLKI